MVSLEVAERKLVTDVPLSNQVLLNPFCSSFIAPVPHEQHITMTRMFEIAANETEELFE